MRTGHEGKLHCIILTVLALMQFIDLHHTCFFSSSSFSPFFFFFTFFSFFLFLFLSFLGEWVEGGSTDMPYYPYSCCPSC